MSHSLLVVATEEGFRVRRATANRWTLRRGGRGWQVVHRTGHLLDGRTDARELLASVGVPPGSEPPPIAEPPRTTQRRTRDQQ